MKSATTLDIAHSGRVNARRLIRELETVGLPVITVGDYGNVTRVALGMSEVERVHYELAETVVHSHAPNTGIIGRLIRRVGLWLLARSYRRMLRRS